MTCIAALAAAHRRLRRRLERLACVAHVDTVPARESPSGHPETEIVAEAAPRRTVPDAVQTRIDESVLRLADTGPHNNPDYRLAVVR